MIAGIFASDNSFLADLSATENRISQDNKQISSGIRVGQASDDPSAIASILEYQSEIDSATQVGTNMNSAATYATSADGALQTASSLLDKLVSIAAQGASSTSTATSRATLGQQVQQIESELVSIANTSVQGTYIFGGDSSSVQPYTFDWTSPEGVVQNSNPSNTATIRDASGNETVPTMTAQQIFDAKNSDGTPTTGNIFQAAYSLGQALLANNQAGAQAATTLLQAGVAQLGSATEFYGNVENWIQQASQDATTRITNTQESLGNIRNTDIAATATQLTLDQTALDAALSAHGSLSTKTLFSYLG